MEAFTHKYNTFKHNVDKVRIFTHKYIAFKYIGCKMEAFTHKYNTFKHIVDKVKLLHTISSSLMYVRGIPRIKL